MAKEVFKGLSEEQLKALDMIWEGQSEKDVARIMEKKANVIQKWQTGKAWQEEWSKRMKSVQAVAAKDGFDVLKSIAMCDSVPSSTRVKAAQCVLDRSGYGPSSNQDLDTEVTIKWENSGLEELSE